MFKKLHQYKLFYAFLVLPIVFVAVGLLIVPSARAFERRSGENVVIGPDEVIDDDLYVFASTLRLQGTVNGDVLFFGQSAIIDGTISGDLIAAGQHIVVAGQVGDDARIAAYAWELNGDLGDDLVAAAFSLHNGANSNVGGDLTFVGYQALLAGPVGGDAMAAGGAVDIQGTIEGDASIDVGGSEADGGRQMPPGFPFSPGAPSVPSVPPGLTVGDQASIGGDLRYTANREVEIRTGAVGGEINFTRYVPQREEKAEPSAVLLVLRWFLRQLRRLITLLLVGALLLWLFPAWTLKMEATVRSRPWPSLGWGAVALGAFIVGMILVVFVTAALALIFGIVTLGELAGRFVTLGLLVLGTAGFGFSVIWAYVTRVIISLLLGRLILRLFGVQAGQETRATAQIWWSGLVGVLIFVLITAIPVLGWLAGFLAALFGLGALWLWAQEWLDKRRTISAKAPSSESMLD